jgi:uncharacterized protein YyaL (SSP411 family)
VLRTWKDGRAKLDGYLEDYALLADALLAVYELTFDHRWLVEARAVAESMVRRFWDSDSALFYDTAVDAEQLIVRPRDVLDNATPAGNSVATMVLLKLAALSGDTVEADRAASVLAGLADSMARYPTAFGELLCALGFYLGPVFEVTIIGERSAGDTTALLREVYRRYQPNRLVLGRAPDDSAASGLTPLFTGRDQQRRQATAYVCVGQTCGLPATSPDALAAQLDG